MRAGPGISNFFWSRLITIVFARLKSRYKGRLTVTLLPGIQVPGNQRRLILTSVAVVLVGISDEHPTQCQSS